MDKMYAMILHLMHVISKDGYVLALCETCKHICTVFSKQIS